MLMIIDFILQISNLNSKNFEAQIHLLDSCFVMLFNTQRKPLILKSDFGLIMWPDKKGKKNVKCLRSLPSPKAQLSTSEMPSNRNL